jgi:DNA polymerase-3 subunit epsilon
MNYHSLLQVTATRNRFAEFHRQLRCRKRKNIPNLNGEWSKQIAMNNIKRKDGADKRLVFVDTETTGLSPAEGHRIIEIAAIEMVGGCLTGREFHTYLNPERQVPPVATDIHGIDDAMLRDQPRFSEVAADLVEFVSDSRVVMHNAPFDAAFLNDEFERIGSSAPALTSREIVIDTLPLFRKLHPGMRCSLAALCERHRISPPADEDWHSALTDASMLARLWLAAGMQG